MSAPITDHERPWLEAWGPRTERYLLELGREEGHPSQVVLGLIGWVASKAHGLPDESSAPTRSRYRKILAELNARGLAPEPGNGRARRRAGQRGDVEQLVLETAATGGGVALLAPQHPAA